MKIIAIYDISSSNKNLNNIRKICSKYLFHIQNSVFEGELEKSELLNFEKEIKKNLNLNIDSFIIYSFFTNIKKTIGINKNNFENYNI